MYVELVVPTWKNNYKINLCKYTFQVSDFGTDGKKITKIARQKI